MKRHSEHDQFTNAVLMSEENNGRSYSSKSKEALTGKDYDAARRHIQAALKYDRNSPSLVAIHKRIWAEIELADRQYSKARTIILGTIDYNERKNIHGALAIDKELLAKIALGEKNYDEARESIGITLAYYREQGKQGALAIASQVLAEIELGAKNYDAARTAISITLRHDTTQENHASIAADNQLLAQIELGAKEYDAARQAITVAINHTQATKNTASLAVATQILAEIEYNAGNYHKARQAIREATAIHKSIGVTKSVAIDYATRANIDANDRRWSDARYYITKASRLRESNPALFQDDLEQAVHYNQMHSIIMHSEEKNHLKNEEWERIYTIANTALRYAKRAFSNEASSISATAYTIAARHYAKTCYRAWKAYVAEGTALPPAATKEIINAQTLCDKVLQEISDYRSRIPTQYGDLLRQRNALEQLCSSPPRLSTKRGYAPETQITNSDASITDEPMYSHSSVKKQRTGGYS